VCTSACSRSDSAATASSSSREHDTAKRGAKAARSRPLAAPSQRFFNARLSSIDFVVCSRSRAGASSAESIMHLPTTARSPIDDSDSNTTSVSWTVSIVSTVVVPESRSSDAASSADARSVEAVCAASIGQIRRFSHSSSGMSSADPRKSV
jgi:hypothetical protein